MDLLHAAEMAAGKQLTRQRSCVSAGDCGGLPICPILRSYLTAILEGDIMAKRRPRGTATGSANRIISSFSWMQHGRGLSIGNIHWNPIPSWPAGWASVAVDESVLELIRGSSGSRSRSRRILGLARCITGSVKRGWLNGRHFEFNAAGAIAFWVTEIKRVQPELESSAWDVWRELKLLNPPQGWLPTGPNDPSSRPHSIEVGRAMKPIKFRWPHPRPDCGSRTGSGRRGALIKATGDDSPDKDFLREVALRRWDGYT